MSKIIIPIEKREPEETPVEEVKTEEKTVLDLAEEPTIKLAPAVPAAPNNMIQKHVDNFLAKIAGETPVDDEVRDSTEYWLNEIANAGFSKMQDLSSDISFIDGISVTTKKVIQTGNLIVVDVNITNATGASIPANTKIADLSNTVCPRTIYFSYVYSGASLKVAYFQQSQLALKLIDELPDNRAIEFHIAYTI